MKNIKKIIYKYASASEIGRMLNITRGAVSHHLSNGKIPAKYAVFYSHLTNGKVSVDDIIKIKYLK